MLLRPLVGGGSTGGRVLGLLRLLRRLLLFLLHLLLSGLLGLLHLLLIGLLRGSLVLLFLLLGLGRLLLSRHMA
jgi:hypothetical protein